MMFRLACGLLAIGLLLLFAAPVSYSQRGIGASSVADPYIITMGPNEFPYWANLEGRTQVSCTITGGASTLVLIVAGQSNSAASLQDPYTASQALNHNFSITNGGCYQSANPMLGTTYGPPGLRDSWMIRAADQLITAGTYTRVILVTFAIGGTSVADWAVGGFANARIGVTYKRMAASGLFTGGADIRMTWQQGEIDTFFGTSQAAYTASWNSMMSTWRGFGLTAPVFIAVSTYEGGVTSAPIRAAQMALVNHTDQCAGPDTDNINNTGRYDTLHFNAIGSPIVASGFVTKLQAYPGGC